MSANSSVETAAQKLQACLLDKASEEAFASDGSGNLIHAATNLAQLDTMSGHSDGLLAQCSRCSTNHDTYTKGIQPFTHTRRGQQGIRETASALGFALHLERRSHHPTVLELAESAKSWIDDNERALRSSADKGQYISEVLSLSANVNPTSILISTSSIPHDDVEDSADCSVCKKKWNAASLLTTALGIPVHDVTTSQMFPQWRAIAPGQLLLATKYEEAASHPQSARNHSSLAPQRPPDYSK
ncbi:hypothetical protein P7C73_g3696, partial [Tremellales sp. Uapishka_1]